MRAAKIKVEESEVLNLRKTQCEKLRFLRKEKGWSLNYVANCLGSSHQYISNIENGKQNLSIDFYNEYLLLLEKC